MTKSRDMVQLLNINEGVGNTRMAREKYEIYKQAILASVPRTESGIPFTELPGRVKEHLPRERLGELGSIGWHVTSVKLDLEARGLIERLPGSKPQRLRRTSGQQNSQSGLGEKE